MGRACWNSGAGMESGAVFNQVGQLSTCYYTKIYAT
jgi:hypothetical protein